jgi:DNA-directed RNA polymerase specialized sigma24 family protein
MDRGGPDVALVRRLAAAEQDDAALGALFRAHGSAVYRYALQVCADRATAEECTVEVFVWLAETGALSYDPTRGSVRAYLVGRVHEEVHSAKSELESAVALAYYGSLTYPEVAAVLGINEVEATGLLWERLESLRRRAAERDTAR